jgi:hypothetical protein
MKARLKMLGQLCGKLNKERIRTMQKNEINCAQVKADLKVIAGESNKIEVLVGVMADILDTQPQIVMARKKQRKLEVSIFGGQYWLSSRDGAIWMHSITDADMVMGVFLHETQDSFIRETFETLPKIPTH